MMYNRISNNGNQDRYFQCNKVSNVDIKSRNHSFPDFEYDLKNIKARYKDGILTVNMIKSTATQNFQEIETHVVYKVVRH